MCVAKEKPKKQSSKKIQRMDTNLSYGNRRDAVVKNPRVCVSERSANAKQRSLISSDSASSCPGATITAASG